MFHQGELVDRFVIVLAGTVDVVRGTGHRQRRLAGRGPGSILGELSLLRRQPRVASVSALSAVRYASGDHHSFEELLGLPGVHQRLIDTAARRMAEIARPLPVVLRDGTQAFVRPLLRSDRTKFACRRSGGLLPESRRRRFFTSGTPSDRLIDYLVNIDYIDHFAWTVGSADGRGLGTARYVREDDPTQAEVAFGVVDDLHGKGLGTSPLGALGAAACQTGITAFVAEVLDDNLPMRRVFDKAGAVGTGPRQGSWRRGWTSAPPGNWSPRPTGRCSPRHQSRSSRPPGRRWTIGDRRARAAPIEVPPEQVVHGRDGGRPRPWGG